MANPTRCNDNSLVYRSILHSDELARIIQTDYPLESPLHCVLIQSGVNDIYLVTAAAQKYILRVAHVRRYGTFNEHTYRFELDLLCHLRNKGLSVSYPLLRRDNDTLGIIAAPEGSRYYALFSFAEGRIPLPMNEEIACVLGEELGKIHLAMDEFSSPHPRLHLDTEFLINEPLRQLRKFPQISKVDLRFLEQLSESLRDSLHGLTQQGGKYGIIHGDFWWENVHVLDRKATFFDFDFCGYGWRAYDVGSLRGTAKALGTNLSADVENSFIKGYQSIRKLTEAELAALPAFGKIRLVWVLGLWTTFVNVLGSNWFQDATAQIISILKKWDQEDKLT